MSAPLFVLSLVCLLVMGSASAQQAVLVGPDLEPQAVELQSFSPNGIEVIDWRGDRRTLSADEVLRLRLSSAPIRAAEGSAVVRLCDGQVLVGEWRGMGQSGDTISLALRDSLTRSISLDDILNVSRREEVPWPGEDADGDTLTLTNGEVLIGFIDAVEETAIRFVLDGTDDAIAVPFDRVHAFSVANRSEPIDPEPGLSRVTFMDGTALLVRDAVLTRREGRWMLFEGAVTLPGTAWDPEMLGPVRLIEPVTGRYALSSLSEIDFELESGGEVFGVPMPPRVDRGGAITMHAPTTLSFDLPRNASRLVMNVALSLDESIPRERRALAGCELVIYEGDQAIDTVTLGPDRGPQRINLPLSGGDLRLELRPGVNGPVLDRVRITDAELLVSNP